MDVDGEVEGTLAQAFGCMGTVDREVLVRQFQQVLGDSHPVSADSCAFFLDMNNWNLQAALGSYYDYGSTNGLPGFPPPEYTSRLPCMQFVQDITIGEGESVPPRTRFLKTWRLRNSGAENWPQGCFLSHIEGEQMADSNRTGVRALMAGEEGDVSVEMTSPALKAIYESRWQLNTPDGLPFGESIWCIISVEETGLLGITQQLASAPLGSPASPHKTTNPFGVSFVQHDSMSLSHDRRRMIECKKFEERLDMSSGSKESVETGCSASMDASLLAIRGSPSSCVQLSLSDVDAPASPNGSTALYAAVAAAFPQQWQQEDSSCVDGRTFVQPSAPVRIIRSGDTPDVPPCTPCTPPDRMQT